MAKIWNCSIQKDERLWRLKTLTCNLAVSPLRAGFLFFKSVATSLNLSVNCLYTPSNLPAFFWAWNSEQNHTNCNGAQIIWPDTVRHKPLWWFQRFAIAMNCQQFELEWWLYWWAPRPIARRSISIGLYAMCQPFHELIWQHPARHRLWWLLEPHGQHDRRRTVFKRAKSLVHKHKTVISQKRINPVGCRLLSINKKWRISNNNWH